MAFTWTPKRLQAVQLMADGSLSDEQIASRVGVNRHTLREWRKRPVFAARLDELLSALAEALKTKGLADKRNRMNAYNRRWRKMEAVIEARAEEYCDVPQAATGLLVRQEKYLGSGEFGKFVDEYAVDVGLLKEMRELEKQAAIEMGEWTEKRDVTSDGQRVVLYLPVPDEPDE